jgi:hypothetical protein
MSDRPSVSVYLEDRRAAEAGMKPKFRTRCTRSALSKAPVAKRALHSAGCDAAQRTMNPLVLATCEVLWITRDGIPEMRGAYGW